MDLDIKYHAAENLFRSFWIDFLEKQLSNKDLDTHRVIDVDGDQILYLEEFDIEIELVPDTKNKSMKLRLGDGTFETLEKQYLAANNIESIPADSECPFVTEATFTIRDIKKGTRFFYIVKKYRGV
jgi:hypothetical protein